MNQSLGLVSLVVREYDAAIAFFVETLGFSLNEDTPVPEENNAGSWLPRRVPLSAHRQLRP
jgi:catechol 2,3-dioxygenase-like lactoylglutathione lyase family enzyme